MTKKKVLIAYGGMVVGGSTTALLSMLKEWDFEKYNVDLVLYDRGFPFEKDIPHQVRVLNGRSSIPNDSTKKLKKGIQYALSPYWIKKRWYTLKYKDRRAGLYAIGQFKVQKLSRRLKERYDIAIGYLEDWSDEFVAYNVEATQKIMWIHLDFANVQYINKSLTERYLSKADKIVCVSVECLKNFNTLFPDLSSRSVYLPNINSAEYIRERSLENLDDDNLKHMKECKKFKIISVCRLSIYHKGIDRMIWAAASMKKSGLIFEWYVIGDGFERLKIEEMIRDNDIEDCFFLLGTKMNPYPFIKQADVFCLPSRYEGKPIVVTETMMLGIPPIVTEYASAKEQIENNVDGIIVSNSDDTIAGALKYAYNNKENVKALKKQLRLRDYSNKEDIEKVYELFND
nr:glycosyltransferase [uncultured Anaerobutyricum sp.]